MPTLLRECHVRREVDSKTPFKSGASRGNRSVWMGGIAATRVLAFPDKWGLVLRSLMLDFTVTNRLRLCWLDATRLRPGHTIEQVVSMGTNRSVTVSCHANFKLLALIFFTCGHCGTTTVGHMIREEVDHMISKVGHMKREVCGVYHTVGNAVM